MLMSIIELFGDKRPFDINGNIRILRFDGWSRGEKYETTTIWEGYGNEFPPPYECWHCEITVMHVTDDGVLEIEFDAGDTDYNPQ